MVLPLNTFGLLGDKNRRAEAVNAYFQKMEEVRRFGGETTDTGTLILHQIFLPTNLAGTYLFEVSVTGYNVTDDAVAAAAAGYINATVNNAGDVTIVANVASSNFGFKNASDAAAATAATVTAQDAAGTTPPTVNINAIGVASKVIQWTGQVRLLSYATANRHQNPVGTELGTDAPAITS